MEDWHGAQHVGPTGPYGIPDTPPHRVGPPSGFTVGGSLVPHRPWSTVLLVVHAFGLAAGVVAFGCGVALFAVAASAPPPDPADGIYEPWGLFIGGLLAVVGVVVIVAAVVLTVLTVHGRRAADQGRPGVLHGLAIAVVTLAGMGAVGSLSWGVLMFLVGLVLCGIYALPGVLILRATRATYSARADSNEAPTLVGA